jgi:mycoredoxin
MLDRLFKKTAPASQNAPPSEVSADKSSKITLFTTSWCPSCRMAKSFLQQRGLGYEEIDIEEVPEAASQVVTWTRGYKTVPTMRVGKTVVIDWNRKAYEKALSEAGY